MIDIERTAMDSVIDRLLFASRRSVFGAVVLTVFLAKMGFARIPNFDVAIVELSKDPLRVPLGGDPSASYLMTNWLGPAVAKTLGVSNERTLFIVYSALSVLFLLLVMRLVFRSVDERNARVGTVLTLGCAVMAVPFHWVGYDSVTLTLLAAIVLVARNDVAVFALGVLGGLQHAELVVVCCALGLVYMVLARSGERGAFVGRKTMVLALAGAVVGRIALEVLFRVRGIEVSSRFDEAIDNLGDAPRQFLGVVVLVVLSGLGVGWIAVVKGWRVGQIGVVATVVPLLLALAISVVTLDQTRITAMSSFYVVLFAVSTNARFLSVISARMVGVIAVAFLLYPGVWVWEGEVSWYANFRGIAQLVELIS